MSHCIIGDCLTVLPTLDAGSVQMCVTSPPYWGLRDYSCDGQLGLESTPEEYVAKMVAVFREVRRVLRDDGTLWLNLGDSYAGGGRGGGSDDCKQRTNVGSLVAATPMSAFRPGAGRADGVVDERGQRNRNGLGHVLGIKPKDLVGIPWRVAFALQQPYREWQIKTEAMRAWVGGIVDGEGCITIMETKSSHSESLSYPPIIQVRMCDLEPLDRLVQVVGSSYGKPQHPPSQVAANQRPSWQWKVVSEQAANVIAEIYPFLTCKRKQAIVAWNHQAFRSARGNGQRAQGDIEKEQFCKTLINKLNQREPVDIPSWMKEPTIDYEPGWYLRQDLIWAKPNPMPESVRDRCTKSHEYIFLLSKHERYYFDADAIAEPVTLSTVARLSQPMLEQQHGSDRVPGKTNGPMKAVGRKSWNGSEFHDGKNLEVHPNVGKKRDQRDKLDRAEASGRMGREAGWRKNTPYGETRNKRSVWTVSTKPYSEAHFATFPPDLIEPCILAGSKPGDVVLDPFGGSGTTGQVAEALGRQWVLIELNPAYAKLAAARTAQQGLQLSPKEVSA